MTGSATAAKATGVVVGVSAVTLGAQPAFLGIPSDVLLAAFCGAMLGLGYTRPETWGTLLQVPTGTRWARASWLLLRTGGIAFTVTTVAIVAAWAVAAAPHVPMLKWTGDIPPIPLVGLLSFGGQKFIPAALAAGVRWFDRRSQ